MKVKGVKIILLFILSLFSCPSGVLLVDQTKQEAANAAFLEVLAEILDDAGKSARKLKVQLAFRLCRRLGILGEHGDVALITKAVGISHSFATRIVHCALNNDAREDDLFERKRASTSFESSGWSTT